jgi:hypothetical protein
MEKDSIKLSTGCAIKIDILNPMNTNGNLTYVQGNPLPLLHPPLMSL